MYELTCPSCERKDELPFVRVGAVLDCDQCGKRYQVDPLHLTNRYPEQAAEQVDNPFADDAAAAVGAGANGTTSGHAQPPGQGQAQAHAQAAIPTNGNGAVATPGRRASDRTAASAAPAPTVTTRSVRQRRAARRRTKRAKTTMLLMGGTLAMLLVAVAILIVIVVTRDDGSATATMPRPPDQHATERPINDVTGAPGQATMVVADQLTFGGWREVDRPIPARTPEDDSLRLLDAHWLFDEGQPTFTATVVSAGHDMLVSAVVRLSLVDESDRLFAQADLPVALVSSQRPSRVSVRVPIHLYDKMRRVHSQFQPGPRMKDAVVLLGTTLSIQGQGPLATAEIETQNITDRALSGAVFLVAAMSRDNQPLAQWRMHWVSPMSPGERVRFASRTPVQPDWDGVRWEIFAVGEPVPEPEPETIDPGPGILHVPAPTVTDDSGQDRIDDGAAY